MPPLVRVGLVGSGSHALKHLKIWLDHSGVNVAAILTSIKRDELCKLKMLSENTNWTITDNEELFFSLVDVVDVCNKNYLHYSFVEKILTNQKIGIVEKPLCIRPREISVIRSRMNELSQSISVVQAYPYNKHFRSVIDVIHDQVPTRAFLRGYWNRRKLLRDPSSWKNDPRQSGGGVLVQRAIHILDFMHYAFGVPRFLCVNKRKKLNGFSNSVEIYVEGFFLFEKDMRVDFTFSDLALMRNGYNFSVETDRNWVTCDAHGFAKSRSIYFSRIFLILKKLKRRFFNEIFSNELRDQLLSYDFENMPVDHERRQRFKSHVLAVNSCILISTQDLQKLISYEIY